MAYHLIFENLFLHIIMAQKISILSELSFPVSKSVSHFQIEIFCEFYILWCVIQR